MSEVVTATKPLAQMSASELREYVAQVEAQANAAEARAIAAEEDAKAARAANAPAAERKPHVYGLTYVQRGALAPDGKLWPLTDDGFEFRVGLDADGGKRVRLSVKHAIAICDELPAAIEALLTPSA